ncbi:MAG: hypothetical protein IPP17_19395 [Bacteroidetes bacterium]|nr:hypothetical protein [Bacteroidota bacterium]
MDANGDYLGGAISLGLQAASGRYMIIPPRSRCSTRGLQWVGDTTGNLRALGLDPWHCPQIEGFIAQSQQLSTQPLSVF